MTKERTKRKLKQLREPFSLLGAVAGLLGIYVFAAHRESLANFLSTHLQPLVNRFLPSAPLVPNSIWITALISLVLFGPFFIWLVTASILSKAKSLKYFQEIDFGQPCERTIEEAIEGLLKGEKAKPFYVHVAPKADEVDVLCSVIQESGFATVRGSPGEGKSMAAYHAAHTLFKEYGYRCYTLKVEALRSKEGPALVADVLSELDSLNEGSFIPSRGETLIIVDDAHELRIKQELNLIGEAHEGNGRYLLIESEYLDETGNVQPDPAGVIRLDLNQFVISLTTNLYGKEIAKNALYRKGKPAEELAKALSEAVSRVSDGTIRDVWHFNLVATRGEERLANEIQMLSSRDLVVLFLVSTYAVVSRELELEIEDLWRTIYGLRDTCGWLVDGITLESLNQIVTNLQRQKLIRVNNHRIISSLHYNSARYFVRTSATTDRVVAAGGLLTIDFRKAAHWGSFVREIGDLAGNFIEVNKNRLAQFLGDASPNNLKCYAPLLGAIGAASREAHEWLIQNLKLDLLAQSLSRAGLDQLPLLTPLLNEIGKRRRELCALLTSEPNLPSLAGNASKAEAKQFEKLSEMLRALGEYKDALLAKLDLRLLADSASLADSDHLQQLAGLLKVVDSRKPAFLDEMLRSGRIKRLAQTISGLPYSKLGYVPDLMSEFGDKKRFLTEQLDLRMLAKGVDTLDLIEQPDDVKRLTEFSAALDGAARRRLVGEIDWASLSLVCPIDAENLSALGVCAENARLNAELTSDNRPVEMITEYLQSHKDEIVRVITDSIEQNSFKAFGSLARFLVSCNSISPKLAQDVATSIMPSRIQSLTIIPRNYRYVARFIVALQVINPDICESFLGNKKVRDFITRSINTHDWSTKVEDLKSLLKAVHDCDKDLWNHITSDQMQLARPGFEELYKEVEIELRRTRPV